MPSIFHLLLFLITAYIIIDNTSAFSPLFYGLDCRDNHLSHLHADQRNNAVNAKTHLVPSFMVSKDIDIPSTDITTSMNLNDHENRQQDSSSSSVNIVLLAGFESFNKDLYQNAVSSLPLSINKSIKLKVFSDSEIRTGASVGVGGATEEDVTNPEIVHAMKHANIFIGSLIFDYEDVIAVEALLDYVSGPRLLFECATELMTYNRVGSFSMEAKEGDESSSMGPPPAVKAILSKFSSGKEEDKLSGYLKLLKM